MSDNIYLIGILSNAAMLVCCGFGFVYGAFFYFRKRKPLFAQLVTCGMGCFFLVHLFNIVNLVCTNNVPSGMNSGIFGFFGAFMFLLSASYGQMDGLADDKSKKVIKYRLISLLAPVCIVLLYLPIVFSGTENYVKIICAFQYLILALTSYYNFKHLIIPDVDLGIIKDIRAYNFLALVLEFAYGAIYVGDKLELYVLSGISGIIIAIDYLIIVPVMKKGVSKWLT